MNDLQKIMSNLLKDIKVMLPCKIISLEGMYADLEIMVNNEDLDLPVVPSVPILYFGNNTKNLRFKNEVGDIVTVLFSQADISKFLITGSKTNTENKEWFNITNSVALPFNIHKKGDEQMATTDFEIIGDMKITGDIEINGNITQVGNLDQTGTTTVSDDVIGGGISLKTHVHPYTWTDPAGAGNTSPPS